MIELSDTPTIIKDLRKIYPEISFFLRKTGQENCLSIFYVHLKDENTLEAKWKKISNTIGAYYQTELKNDSEKYNIYIFYICEELVAKQLKYEIENDRFICRKIIIEGQNTCDDSLQEQLVQEKIEFKVNIPSNTTVLTQGYSPTFSYYEIVKRIKAPNRIGNGKVEYEKALSEIEKLLIQ